MRNTAISFLTVIMLFPAFLLSAQQNAENEGSGIALNAIVPDLGENFNERNRRVLQSKLDRITTNYGTGGTNFDPNFVLVPDVYINGYETTGGAPARTLAKLEVVLQVANAQAKTKFSSLALKTRGVGENKDEALHDALSKMDTRNSRLENFIKEAKTDIQNYYDEHCDALLKKAMTQAEAEKFKEAFSYLYRIPSGAECYNEAMTKVEEVFSKYRKVKCTKLLSTARAAHSAGNMDKAAQYLALIPTGTECQEKAKKLANKMEDERIMKYKEETEIKKIKARAAKEIAIAFAKNQPDKKVDIRFLKGE